MRCPHAWGSYPARQKNPWFARAWLGDRCKVLAALARRQVPQKMTTQRRHAWIVDLDKRWKQATVVMGRICQHMCRFAIENGPTGGSSWQAPGSSGGNPARRECSQTTAD